MPNCLLGIYEVCKPGYGAEVLKYDDVVGWGLKLSNLVGPKKDPG